MTTEDKEGLSRLSDAEREELRKYLLGRVSAEERLHRIEERLLTDDDYFEELQITKDELIDDYLDDSLTASERSQFEASFNSTPDRRRELRFAKSLRRHISPVPVPHLPAEEPKRTKTFAGFNWMPRLSSPYVVAFSSVLILLLGGLVAWRLFLHKSDLEQGLTAMRAAFGERRYVESRIAGFNYAPLIQVRGGEAKADDVQKNRAERLLLDAAHQSDNVATHHALGQLRLAERKFGEAIAQFREALKRGDGPAQLHSDLGAALLEAGRESLSAGDNSKSLEEFAQSLEHLDKALALEPRLPEALFNRALVLQQMGVTGKEREAWQKYLEVDPNSGWAEEARRNLERLTERRAEPQDGSQLLRSFLEAQREGDEDRAWRIISQNREMITGKLIPWQLSVAYLNHSLEGRTEEANEALRALSYAGDLEARRAGDPYFSQLSSLYASLPKTRWPALARAHRLLSDGYGLCQKAKFSEALELFAEARRLFVSGGDSYHAGLAEYWTAYCDFNADHTAESLARLTSLTAHCEASGHRWLLTQALSLLANVRAAMNEHSKSLELDERALKLFEEMSDSYGIQKSLSQIGNTYRYLGGQRKSLGYLQRCLEVARSTAYSPRQMWRNYEVAAQTFYALGLNSAAAAYGDEALHLGLNEIRDPAMVYITSLHLGIIQAKLGNHAIALSLAEQGLEISRSRPEGKVRDYMVANSALHLAHLSRYAGAHAEAVRRYNEAIETYDRLEAAEFQKYEAHKGRLLCHVALGDDAAVKIELPVVLALFEKYRPMILEEQNRNSFFDAEQGVYDMAIGYEYARAHNPQQAFEYSEASRARSLLDMMKSGAASAAEQDVTFRAAVEPLPLTAIRERLPKRSQLVQYAALDDRLLIWFISGERFEATERPVGFQELNAKVLDYLRLVESGPGRADEEETRRAATELYRILIEPIEPLLETNSELCLIPDKVLNHLPFAALVSPRSGNYLIEDYALLYSPSSNVFLLSSDAASRADKQASERLLAVGDPSFDRASYPQLTGLPSARREAESVAGLYRGPTLLTGREATKARVLGELGRADVAHFACHYVADEHSYAMSKLILSGAPGVGELRAIEVFGSDLKRTRLIVLSACRTAAESYRKGEGMVGMARAFLASGVPLVVASQWEVDSEATASLMTSFHRHRRLKGLSTTKALQLAQIDILRGPNARYRQPFYWAAFLPVGGHADF
jgi:CHAT domain-containing protein